MSMSSMPKVLVLSCLGGSQGDLGVVRALGRKGIHVVLVSEYEDSIARYSRYTKEFYVTHGFGNDSLKIKEFLIDYAKKQDHKPVLFPTADPDLKMLSDERDDLEKYYSLFISSKEIINGFMDKAKFFDYASEYNFPIPNTIIPKNIGDLNYLSNSITYPAIIKPIHPYSWVQKEIKELVERKKAVKVNNAIELHNLYESISKYNSEMVIQEYIPGRDDHLYSLHIYMNKKSEPVGYFTGRKLRTYPVYAGIGCFVESILVPEIIEYGIKLLKEVNYTGLALMQFKYDPRDNDFKLIEINPRVSSWNSLAYECGVNLPYIAYCDAIGKEVSKQNKQSINTKYVFFEHDFHAFLDYRKDGELTIMQWIKSYKGKKVYQYMAFEDLRPFIISTLRTLINKIKKIM